MSSDTATFTRAMNAVRNAGLTPAEALRLPPREAMRRCIGLGPRGLEALREAERSAQPTLVVTRHAALLDYLREQGIVAGDARIIVHAAPEDVRDQHVVGVLPFHLAAEAASVTEVGLDLRPDQRGRELSLAEVRAAARGVRRYVVERVG